MTQILQLLLRPSGMAFRATFMVVKKLFIGKRLENISFYFGGFFKEMEDHSIGWGERIEPFSEEDAKAWALKRVSGEEYISIFGDVEE